MSEQRIARRWIVKANGIEQTEVEEGTSVEIGRKPLRPLPDDGFERMEIEDSSRSMSKRHAVFSVDEHGSAVLRDLNSTNGSYVVGDRGGLMRLQGGVDFPLPMSPMRMQFGDVPVDFVQMEEPGDEEEEEPVAQPPDLFSYATDEAKPEPGMADMSVDDILNLRAGEPTTALSTRTVAGKVNALKASAAFSFPPTDEAGADEVGTDEADHAAADGVAGGESEDQGDAAHSDGARPEDRQPDGTMFPDAQSPAGAERSAEQNQGVSDYSVSDNGTQPESAQPAGVQADSARADSAQAGIEHAERSDDETRALPQGKEPAQNGSESDTHAAAAVMAGHASARISVNIMQPGQGDAAPQRDLFVDALSDGGENEQAEADGDTAETQHGAQADSGRAEHRDYADRSGHAGHPEYAGREIGIDEIFSASHRDGGAVLPALRESADIAPIDVQGDTHDTHDTHDDAVREAVKDERAADETNVFTPAFEPGSVFERVSKGDFGKREPAVDIDGLTSDDAKRTGDFTVQFEMAKHPQLLPFLAMNPSLYDDLYAWLAALGDKDIDAALARNAGYEEYRTAVGK